MQPIGKAVSRLDWPAGGITFSIWPFVRYSAHHSVNWNVASYLRQRRRYMFLPVFVTEAAKFRSLYDIGESNPVPASELWPRSGSKVNQFVHVPTSVNTQHFIQIHHAFLSNLANRQTDKQTRAKTKNQRMSEEWQWRRRILVKGRGRFYMNIFECLFPPLFCIFSTGIRYHRRLFIIKSSEILGSYPIWGARPHNRTLKFIKLCRNVWVLRDNTGSLYLSLTPKFKT